MGKDTAVTAPRVRFGDQKLLAAVYFRCRQHERPEDTCSDCRFLAKFDAELALLGGRRKLVDGLKQRLAEGQIIIRDLREIRTCRNGCHDL